MLEAAIASLNNNIYYLRAIASMAQERDVVVAQEVNADSGEVLLLKGSKVDGTLLERLLGRRLSRPLDAQLVASDPVDLAVLQQTMAQLRAEHPLAMALCEALGSDTEQLEQALQQLVWPHDASFKMTVMRSQLPTLFSHSVLVMMVAVFLGVRSGWSTAQCSRMAAAALLHDIGMLYLPTSWMNTEYRLSDAERRQLAAHTVTGSAVVQAMYAYPQSVADAVLEHHEYVDGSGYPQQLQGEAVSPMGQVLTVAEVVAACYDKYAEMAGERLSLMLRLHRSRYAAALREPMLEVVQRECAHHAPAAPMTQEEVLHDSVQVAKVLGYWASCKRVLPERWQALPGGRAVMWMDARLQTLEMSLAESGAHVRHQAEWQAILQQEPALVLELGLIYREALWQLESCIYNGLRRWPQLPRGSAAVERALWTWMTSSAHVLGIADTLPQSSQPQPAA